ncbi:Transmembrane -like protein [Trichinella papuae]|uniref:Transmembrane-like protein n=1 Tax=Trichinella papuae TaxID=268474 RepID=A0A0V1N7M4_9BILA|nr:Transmembrane -like protein [Trichinella papuae]
MLCTMKCKFCPDYRSSKSAKIKNEQTHRYNKFNRRPRGNERQYIIGIVGRGNGDELDVDKYVSRLSWHVELQSNASISVSFLFAVYFIYSRANFSICSSIDYQKQTQATFASHFFIVQSIFPSSFISMLRHKFSILDLLNSSVFQNYNPNSRLLRQGVRFNYYKGSKSRSTKSSMPIFSMVGGSKLCRLNNGKPETSRIPAVLRFYIYALHGLATEIVFTALFEIVINGGNRKLHGLTSIWAAFIYGFTMLTGELVYLSLQDRCSLLVRGFFYLIWAYIWEFRQATHIFHIFFVCFTGLLLRQFDACPWDYGHYPGQFMGLITVVYAPFWYVAGLLTEILLIRRALNVPSSSSSSTVFAECNLKND